MAKKKNTKKTKKKMDVSYGVDNIDENLSDSSETSSATDETSSATEEVESAAEEVEIKPKKNLIEEINEMKAKNETKSEGFKNKMSELESILGVDQINPFGTNELDIFEDNLKGMTYNDMRDLAHKVGVNPFYAQPQLKQMLIKEFKSSNKNNMKNIMPTPKDMIKLDPNNPQHAKTIKLLGEQ